LIDPAARPPTPTEEEEVTTMKIDIRKIKKENLRKRICHLNGT
jgi:hypothetical protein